MIQKADTSNGIYLAVSGGFCDSYGPAAPFGEGTIFAFAEGNEFLFRIQYGWRPKSAIEQRANIPWRIAPATARKYIEAIKASLMQWAGPAHVPQMSEWFRCRNDSAMAPQPMPLLADAAR